MQAGATTRILTADDPADTTSNLATAMVGPTFRFSGPRITAWESDTVLAFTRSPSRSA